MTFTTSLCPASIVTNWVDEDLSLFVETENYGICTAIKCCGNKNSSQMFTAGKQGDPEKIGSCKDLCLVVETLTGKYIFKIGSILTWYHGQAVLLHGFTCWTVFHILQRHCALFAEWEPGFLSPFVPWRLVKRRKKKCIWKGHSEITQEPKSWELWRLKHSLWATPTSTPNLSSCGAVVTRGMPCL